jgi:adenosylcobyric acid synthase
MSGGLLVAGTTSDAGKSMLVTGICRWLRRRGVRVAPFKAQNMSNNSVVAPDGGEIGRAQVLQAAACGLTPSVRFNPVLLKPGGDGASQVVLRGRAVATLSAGNFRELRPALASTAFETLAELRGGYDVVVCEGAGSPAEINLRDGDFVNMGLARRAGLPVVVVGDIDRGGVFASFYGTLALLDPEDQALLCGWVVNKFRGERALLAPGIAMLEELTGRACHGVLPWHPELWLDAEDSLSYHDGRLVGRPAAAHGTAWLRVAVIRLPQISNGTDVDAIAAEPGVAVRLTTSPAEIADADLVVLPGSKSTVEDLTWLRANGLAAQIEAHARSGRPLLGICGGYQMLARRIHDEVESCRGTVAGLGLLPVEIAFAREKMLGVRTGRAFGVEVSGYEIHHGYESTPAATHLITLPDGAREGAVEGSVFGTHWHGTLESDAFRRALLTEVARLAGRTGFAVAPGTEFAALRERQIDLLGDLVEEHLDTAALWRLIEAGPPDGLPPVPPAGPR